MIKVASAIAALVVFPVAIVHAQSTCGRGTAYRVVQTGRGAYTVANGGRFFWSAPYGDPLVAPPSFHVQEEKAIYSASFWIAGLVDGTMHYSGSRSGWMSPGPRSTQGAECAAMDRVFVVSGRDLDAYSRTGIATADMRDWPSQLGAPVADGNGDPDDYDLYAGDLPAVVGESSAWWIMHDLGPDSSHSGRPYVGVEEVVQVSTVADRYDLYAVAVRARMKYQGHARLDSAYLSVYLDPDLGFFENDRSAVDTLNQLGYAYDIGPDPESGASPAAVGVVLVRGPLAILDGVDNDADGVVDEPGERLKLVAFATGNSGAHERDPYLGMQGRCVWGAVGELPAVPDAQQPNPCDPTADGKRTPFWFSGDPVAGTGWLLGAVNLDQVFLVTTGPFSMQPGEEVTTDWGFVWARGTDWRDSIIRLRSGARALLDYSELLDPPTQASQYGLAPEPKPLPESSGVDGLWPNPASTSATLRVSVELETHVTVELFDVFGRRVLLLEKGVLAPGVHDIAIPVDGLAAELYTYRVSIGNGSTTGSLVVVR